VIAPTDLALMGLALAVGLWMIAAALKGWCKHDWEVKVNERLPSGWEVHNKHGPTSMKGTAFPIDVERMSRERQHTVLVCKKCGKLRVVRS